jgi:hypothetical protein
LNEALAGFARRADEALKTAVAACREQLEKEHSVNLEAAVAATRKSITERKVMITDGLGRDTVVTVTR